MNMVMSVNNMHGSLLSSMPSPLCQSSTRAFMTYLISAWLQDLERGFTNKQEALESINGRGTSLVNGCEDQLTKESGRSRLSDLNEAWSECLGGLSEREEVLKKALELAEKYEVHTLYSRDPNWMCKSVKCLSMYRVILVSLTAG